MSNSAISKTNQNLLMKSEALKQIYEHNRDYLSLTLTIPLGDKALKKVHTNQWLFTNLPKEFDLANWTVLAEALNSAVNRYELYVKNKWYIEAVDISVENGGNAEMSLTLNAFASSHSDYASTSKEMQKAYTDALQDKSKAETKVDKNNSSAVSTKKSVINEKWVKKYNIPSEVTDIIKKVCKVNKSDEQNVKAWFNWMDKHINYAGYYNHQRSFKEQIKKGGGNCVDNSRLFRAGCQALGVKCNFVKNTCTSPSHQYNKVYLNGKGIIVDTGRELASWGSNWGGHSSCGQETSTSW